MLSLITLLAAAAAHGPCTALPSALVAWDTPSIYARGLQIGQATTLRLYPAPAPSGATGYQFETSFVVSQAGRYAVAASDKSWIEVRNGDRQIKSVAHQPGCQGVRKIVMFDLQPGRYAVAFTENPTPELRVMVLRWAQAD